MSQVYRCNYSTLAGDDITVIGTSNKISGARVTIHGNYNHLLSGSVADLQGTSNIINGNAGNVRGNYNTVNGNADNVDGTSNDVAGNAGNVHGNYNKIGGNCGNIDGTNNSVGGNAGNVNGNYNKIGGCAGRIRGTGNSSSNEGVSFTSSIGNIDFATSNVSMEMEAMRNALDRGIHRSVVINENGGVFVNGLEVTASKPKPVKPPVPAAIDNEPDAKPGETLCCICLRRAVNTCNKKCNHACLCVTCARDLAKEPELKCPKCRAILKRIERLYIDYEE